MAITNICSAFVKYHETETIYVIYTNLMKTDICKYIHVHNVYYIHVL